MVTDRSRIPTAPRRIEYVRLDNVPPAFRNPKGHDKAHLRESIRVHGFADAGILDERTGRLVAGHGRTEELIDMRSDGERIPDGIMVDEDGMWLVPIQRGWASRNDAEAEAFIIRHNRLVEAGGWDDRMLAEMLHDVHAADADLFDGMGVTSDELDKLLSTVDADRLGEDPPDHDAGSVADMPARTRYVTCPSCYHEFVPGEDY